MLMKILLHAKDGQIVIVTLTQEQAINLFANAAFYGVKQGSSEMSELILQFVEQGHVKAVSVSKKSREQLIEEMKRNYGQNVLDLDLNEEPENGQ